MAINRDTLRGYILEEVLAYLISRTGYKLLVDPEQDPRDLARRGNGLVVKGRGGDHQVDVLGELMWIPAFTFPLRLFVEAKFRIGKAGIDAVRNAVGVVLDINQKNSPTREQEELPQYHRYAYTLFSTSGFSKPAVNMAIAHQISLIDLGGAEFDSLRSNITRAADTTIDLVKQQSGLHDRDVVNRGRLVSGVRNILRTELGTWPEEVPRPIGLYDNILIPNTALAPAIQVAHQYDELFVAMAHGPFMLLLKEDELGTFLEYANRHRRHEVDVTWSRHEDKGRTWAITPRDNREAYRLTFRLPEALSEWVFSMADDARRAAIRVKQTYFSDITIYRHIHGEDYLYRLVYDRQRLDRIDRRTS